MDVVIRIRTDNDAFKPDEAQEVARILGVVGRRLTNEGLHGMVLHDVNGNTVGALNLVWEDEG